MIYGEKEELRGYVCVFLVHACRVDMHAWLQHATPAGLAWPPINHSRQVIYRV